MENEKVVKTSEEVETKKDKLFKKPDSRSMYQKHRDDESDPETEAFARGELNKFNEEKAEVELLRIHPDFSDLRQEDDFHEWAGKQDPTIQGWLYENTSNATLAARAIDLYKMDRGISDLSKKESTNLKKEAAKAISKTKKAVESDIPTKKIWSNSEIGKMDRKTFAKFEAEIDEASREGRIQP